ncbi:unnamed protein product [Blepharisma stoltei]|uniref:Uncharacterized protein n=1 Tax=Blepharisma stoltei TaxID=1481888 RepID=A0AAU9ITR7_9CILI|nr:unnamed protein product [Blepharisma stoltei]
MGCCSYDRQIENDVDDLGNRSSAFNNQFTSLKIVSSGSISELKQFLDRGFPTKYKMPAFNGATILHLAAEKGNASMIKLLMEYGADVESFDDRGMTPIFYSIKGRNQECFRVLVKTYNANMNVVNSYDKSVQDYLKEDPNFFNGELPH